MLRSTLFLSLLALILYFPAQSAFSQAPAQEDMAENLSVVPEGLKSPRATMETFLHAMNDIKRGQPKRINDALTALDLSAVNPLVRKERGSDLAWMLLEIMDRTRLIDPKRISEKSEGNPYLFKTYEKGSIRIARYKDGRWLFDKESIEKLPQIMEEVSGLARVKIKAEGEKSYLPFYLKLKQQIPQSFKRVGFLLENWQWIGLFIIVLLGVIADKLIGFFLSSGVKRWRERTEHAEFKAVSEQILRPLGLMLMAVIWWLGINLMGLPETILLVLLVAVKFLASLSGVWAAYRLVDLVSIYLMKRAQGTESKLDDALVPLIPRTLKIFITIIGFVFIADNINIDISSLLAGLGLGGLAFALAAKDMVQNLFGSVTVLMDRTFSVGDWVKVAGVEGSVEAIGFRSTRVRTFYNSVVTVPNSTFITANVDNMGARRYRRLSCKLSLTYDTPPDLIEAFCEGVRELIRQHPYMRKDYYHVYFNEFAASSLDVLLYVFWETPEWNTELRERHRFLLDILRLAKSLGVEFAYPSQTIYMKNDDSSERDQDEMSADIAMEMGRTQAKQIVSDTMGLGVKPPPVVFPPIP